jgi:hypothetical protein
MCYKVIVYVHVAQNDDKKLLSMFMWLRMTTKDYCLCSCGSEWWQKVIVYVHVAQNDDKRLLSMFMWLRMTTKYCLCSCGSEWWQKDVVYVHVAQNDDKRLLSIHVAQNDDKSLLSMFMWLRMMTKDYCLCSCGSEWWQKVIVYFHVAQNDDKRLLSIHVPQNDDKRLLPIHVAQNDDKRLWFMFMWLRMTTKGYCLCSCGSEWWQKIIVYVHVAQNDDKNLLSIFMWLRMTTKGYCLCSCGSEWRQLVVRSQTRMKFCDQIASFWHDSPQWARASLFARFLYHTQRRTTFGRTPLDEWSVRRKDLCLTKHNTHNRQTSMLRWDSNPQSQQASGRKSTTWTTQPLGPALGSVKVKVKLSRYRPKLA